MLLFGHLGITAGVAHAVNKKFGYDLDVRKAALLGIAPDLLDKPPGLLYPNVFENHTRLLGHHALFCLIVLGVFLLLKRRIKHPWLYWGAYMTHILLDRVWHDGIENFLWPLVGKTATLEQDIVGRWYDAFFRPYNLFGEITGVLILVYLAFEYRARRRSKIR